MSSFYKGRDDSIFSRLTEQGIAKETVSELSKRGTFQAGKEIPSDVEYSPPQGKRLFGRFEKREIEVYQPGTPTAQTDLLADCERQFILPFAVPMSLTFRSPPITDDAYRYIPDEIKDDSLFFLLSRTDVKRLPNGFITWTPIVVVIKRMVVTRIRACFHPNDRHFFVQRVRLWQNKTNSYYVIEDKRLTKEVILNVIAKYIEMEGIFKRG